MNERREVVDHVAGADEVGESGRGDVARLHGRAGNPPPRGRGPRTGTPAAARRDERARPSAPAAPVTTARLGPGLIPASPDGTPRTPGCLWDGAWR